ncbi:MAG: hypothetical protein R3253_13160 [Longimicrobiales bacterium]|nr:hypothetical protein [Longimicrobiales bacterium]
MSDFPKSEIPGFIKVLVGVGGPGKPVYTLVNAYAIVGVTLNEVGEVVCIFVGDAHSRFTPSEKMTEAELGQRIAAAAYPGIPARRVD